MIVGDISQFAVESELSTVLHDPHFLGIGFFNVYIGGKRYGVRENDATALAAALEEVGIILRCRGLHVSRFAEVQDPGLLVTAFRNAVYIDDELDSYLGVKLDEFVGEFDSRNLAWGSVDEAFDDSTYILQFDVGETVRVIGFKADQEHRIYNPDTLSDVLIGADNYYGVLFEWHERFLREWESSDKQ